MQFDLDSGIAFECITDDECLPLLLAVTLVTRWACMCGTSSSKTMTLRKRIVNP